MNTRFSQCSELAFLVCALISVSTSLAFHSGLSDAAGDYIFSQEFIRDYEMAQKAVDEKRSAEPLIGLLKKYKKTEERAELELSIGLTYNQRTGVIDPENAVHHLTNALKYALPERTYLEICLWRGNSLQALNKYDEAIKDYIRGLIACSYHDLSGGWPEIKPSNVPIYGNSDDPENPQRVRDYQQYRKTIGLQQFLLRQRYYFIEAVRQITSKSSIKDEQVLKHLAELTPDSTRFESIMTLLKAENKRPWP